MPLSFIFFWALNKPVQCRAPQPGWEGPKKTDAPPTFFLISYADSPASALRPRFCSRGLSAKNAAVLRRFYQKRVASLAKNAFPSGFQLLGRDRRAQRAAQQRYAAANACAPQSRTKKSCFAEHRFSSRPVLGSRLSFARRKVLRLDKKLLSLTKLGEGGGVWELNRRPKVWKKNIVSSGASTITQKIKNLDLNIESKVN